MTAIGNSFSGWSISYNFLLWNSLAKLTKNLVGSIYGRSSIKDCSSSWSINKHGHHRQFLFLVGRFLKVFSSETAWRNTANLYKNMITTGNSCFWLDEIYKNLLLWNLRRHNELLLCRNDVWEILTQFPYFVPITQPIWKPYSQFLFMINQLKEIFSKTIWPN